MVKIIGHRGAPALAPENTIESYESAIGAGADYIECDVQMTRDGRLVLIHDDTVDRTTNGKGNVRDFTFDELRALTIEGRLRIPAIEDVLDLGFPTMLDLGSYREGNSYRTYDNLAADLLRTIEESGSKQEIVILFTNAQYLDQLSETPLKKINLLPQFSGLATLSATDLYGIGVFYHDLTSALIDEAHGKDLKVFSWPMDREDEIERAISLGLDLLVSDNPGHAIYVARKLGQRSDSESFRRGSLKE